MSTKNSLGTVIFDNDYILESLDRYDKQIQNEPGSLGQQMKFLDTTESLPGVQKTSGNALFDFLGQAVWGGVEALSMETLGVADTYYEATRGDDYRTWEEAISEGVGGVAGDFNELTGSGKAGYIVGQALGSIPSFFFGGMFAKGAVKGGGKVFSVGTKAAVNRSAREIAEVYAKKDVISKAAKKAGVKAFDDKLATNIAKESHDIFAAHTAAKGIEKGISKEIFEEAVSKDIVSSISQVAGTADLKLLEPLSKEVLQIVTRNNPADAQKLLYLLSSRITDAVPGLNKLFGVRANMFLGAAGYDAMIGVGMGLLRGGIHSFQQSRYGVERNEYGEKLFTGKFNQSWSEIANSTLHHMATDAYHFAFLGPAKFVKGGTGAAHGKRLRNIMFQHVNKWMTPTRRMSRDQLKWNLSALNEISGRRINQVFEKYSKKGKIGGKEWWMSNSASKTEMAEMLKALRNKFARQAYPYWAKEFGVDVVHSLPRMMAGVAAMNMPNLIKNLKEYGADWEVIKRSLGDNPQEIAANVWVAAFFTRRPHSFHAEVGGPTFKRMFETGTIRDFNKGSALMGMVNFKAHKFRRILGSVNTFSKTKAEQFEKIVQTFSPEKAPYNLDDHLAESISHEFESTYEFGEIRKTINEVKTLGKAGGNLSSLRPAINEAISKKIKANELTIEESRKVIEDMFVVEEYLDMYKKRTKVSTGDLLFSPEGAFETVAKLSQLEFSGKKLTIHDIEAGKLQRWKEKTTSAIAEVPQDIYKTFLIGIYKELGLPYKRDEAANTITAPDIEFINSIGGRLAGAIATAQNVGRENNWLSTGKKGAGYEASAEQITKMDRVLAEHSDAFMEFNYGKEWRGDLNVDQTEVETIFTDPSWFIHYDRPIRLKQRVDAYELLTHGKDHSYEPADADSFLSQVRRFVEYSEAPKLDKEGKDSEKYGEYKEFIDNMHEINRLLHPEEASKGLDPPVLTLREAKEFYDRGTSLTGDLFTDAAHMREFKIYSIERAVENLGLNNINLEIDYRASVAHLATNSKFNKGEDGEIRFPDYKIVSDALAASKIDAELKKEILRYYDTFAGKAKDANFPVKFDNSLVEDVSGDFVTALHKSLTVGKIHMDTFTAKSSWIMLNQIQKESTRIGSLIEGLSGNSFNLSKEQLKKSQDMLVELLEIKPGLESFEKLITDAITSQDPYTLRALAKEEANLKRITKALESQAVDEGSLDVYNKAVLELQLRVENQKQKMAFSESGLKDFIAEEMEQFAGDIPGKDVKDFSLMISINQFKSKYKMTTESVEQIFEVDKNLTADANEIRIWGREILRDFHTQSEEFKDLMVKNPKLLQNFNTIKDSFDRLAGDISFDVKKAAGATNFINYVIRPLKLAVDRSVTDMKTIDKPAADVIDADIYSIAKNHFSKTVIKTLKPYLKSNKLLQGRKTVGYTTKRGFTGILHRLDPSQNSLWLLEKSAIDVDGSVITDVRGRNMDRVNNAFNKGNFEVLDLDGKADVYRHLDVERLESVGIAPAKMHARYRIVSMNEGTSLVVRLDRHKGSLHENISAEFRGPDKILKDEGGSLYKELEAIYDGDFSKNTPQHTAMRDLLVRLQNPHMNDVDLINAVKLTRAMLNFPGFIKEIYDGHNIDLEHKFIKDVAKRDKMNDPKNGYIATPENVIKTKYMYQYSESRLYQKAIEKTEAWFDPNKKLKIASINDEGTVSYDGKEITNIFSSVARMKHDLEVDFNKKKDLKKNKKISKEELASYKSEYEFNLKAAEKVQASIVNGETFLNLEPQLAFMMMHGLTKEMVRTDSNGEVIGFKSGAVKPTVTWAQLMSDKANSNYGRIQQYYIKTASKYNPAIEKLSKKLGVDGITFKSANKINTLKEKANAEQKDMYMFTDGVIYPDGEFSKSNNWIDYLSNVTHIKTKDGEDMQQRGAFAGESIVQLPLEAFNIRVVSKEHDPMIGQNAGVHMHHDNGIASWIGTQLKADNHSTLYHGLHSNILHRTAIAKVVMGHNSQLGDPSMMNSIMSNVLLRDGIILEPFLLRKLEQDLITYSLNNGSIAGGIVEHGSMDVMSADLGNLRPTIRSNIGDRPTVRLFGEYASSYYAANKPWARPADIKGNVHNVIIQRIKYQSEADLMREADAYMVYMLGEPYLMVEGRMMDKSGKIYEVDGYLAGEQQAVRNEDTKINLKVFKDALAKDQEVLNAEDIKGDHLFGPKYKLLKLGKEIESFETEVDGIKHKLAIAMLNTRQPRNMMGDVVISKMAKGLSGEYHVDKNSGNVSRMNYSDAISPQDADFDFDKSFNYTAAPTKYWTQVGKVAGYTTNEGFERASELFNPYNKESRISDKLKSLIGTNAKADVIEHEANLAKGQFIKMHQTTTYLSNIYRNGGVVAEWQHATGQILQMRLNTKGKYVSTVKNISAMAKDFIDLYQKPPSLESMEFGTLRGTQDKIYFGKEGMFEIYSVNKFNVNEITLLDLNTFRNGGMNDMFQHVRQTVRARIIDPLNTYLKYNKGMEEDPSGITSKATLKAYHDAYFAITNSAINPKIKFLVDERVNMETGLTSVANYFSESQAPYDIAMKNLYQTYYNSASYKKSGNVGQGMPGYVEIAKYIENGQGRSGEDPVAARQRILEKVLTEYVKDESRVLHALDLRKELRNLNIQVQEELRYWKGDPNENIQVQGLKERLARTSEIMSTIKEALAYRYGDRELNPPEVLRSGNFAQGVYKNKRTDNKPIVVVDTKGNISEVIFKGGDNKKRIYANSKLIVNGRRFELPDAQEQHALRVLHEAFGDIPVIIDEKGNHHQLSHYELQTYMRKNVLDLSDAISKKIDNMPNQTQFEKNNRRIEKERIIHSHLFELNESGRNEIWRKAFIMRLLTPGVSKRVTAYRKVGESAITKDYLYYENALSEPTMSLLSKMATGEYRGDRAFAEQVLKDIEINKLIGYTRSENPHLDMKLAHSKMFGADVGGTPMSIENNAVLRPLRIDQRIFEKLEDTDAVTRESARIIIDFAQGKDIVDGKRLYKATRAMEKAGIDRGMIWGQIKFVTDAQGNLKKYGASKLRISELDRIGRRNLGEHGGKKKSTFDWVQEQINCIKK